MAAAYAVFANGGYAVEPYGVLEVRQGADVLYRRTARSARRVVSAETAGEMTDMLRSVVDWGTGRAAGFGVPVAGKTGTSQDFRDAWFVGHVVHHLVEDLARPVAAFLPSFASVVAVSDIFGAAGTRTEALVALSILATVFAIAALPGVWWLVFTERERGFVAARVSMFISNTGLQCPAKRVGS